MHNPYNIPNYACYKHNLHWLGTYDLNKAPCKVQASSLKDFLSKSRQSAKNALIMHNPYNIPNYACYKHNLHWLGTYDLNKAPCKVQASSLKDFLSKSRQSAKNTLIMHNPYNIPNEACYKHNLHWLGAYDLNKAPCKVQASSLKNFVCKSRQSAKNALIMHNYAN